MSGTQKPTTTPVRIEQETNDASSEESTLLGWSDARLAGIHTSFLPPALMTCFLPREKPSALDFERHNGSVSLIGEATSFLVDDKKIKPGLAYGTPGRLIIAGLCTLAVIQKARVLELPKSFGAWLRFLGAESSVSMRSGDTRRRYFDHMLRVAGTLFTVSKRKRQEVLPGGRARVETGWYFEKFALISAGEIWWDRKSPDREAMFPTTLRLSDTAWQWLQTSVVPFGWDQYRALAGSELAMDWLNVLAHRLPQIPESEAVTISWLSLFHQFMGEPATLNERGLARVRRFRAVSLKALSRALEAYRAPQGAEALVDVLPSDPTFRLGGLRFRRSAPMIKRTGALLLRA